MNIYSSREFQDRVSDTELNDDMKMEQIRELLHGELKRQHEARLASLELRVRELEGQMFARLEQLQAQLEALSTEITHERRSQLEQLGRGLLDLGERVHRLSRD